MARLLKSGIGWRIGWDSAAETFKGLVGSDDWALELTPAEFDDFCRLFEQLIHAIDSIQNELMDEEAIACEVESSLVWLEADGYPHAYHIHLMLLSGRRGEGKWHSSAISELHQAIQSIQVF